MGMKSLRLLACLTCMSWLLCAEAALLPDGASHQKFDEFKTKYRKKYRDSSEEMYRSLMFCRNSQFVDDVNKDPSKSYKLKVNQFGDLSQEQFNSMHASLWTSNRAVQEYAEILASAGDGEKGLQTQITPKFEKDSKEVEAIVEQEKTIKLIRLLRQSKKRKSIEERLSQLGPFADGSIRNDQITNADFTSQGARRLLALTGGFTISTSSGGYNVDWTGYAGEIREQGQCGACYVFSAVQNLETLKAIYTFGFPIQLSVQQLIDCSTNDLSFGCNGGFLQGPFVYLKTYGVVTEFSYPYTSGSNGGVKETCKAADGLFKVASFKSITSGNCLAVKQELKSRPISVGIASYRLQFYSSGTFTDCDTIVDHAVLLIGFSTLKGWKIKNTWGTGWGQAGYAWLADGNSCGICQEAISATLSDEGQVQMLRSKTTI